MASRGLSSVTESYPDPEPRARVGAGARARALEPTVVYLPSIKPSIQQWERDFEKVTVALDCKRFAPTFVQHVESQAAY